MIKFSNSKKISIIDIKVLIPCIIILLCLGFLLHNFSTSNYTEEKIVYSEQEELDYKVFYQKNEYFTEPYLEKNRTYITTLIDYIDIDFSYSLNFSEDLTGSYTYYIKGVISADKTNDKSGNYWSRYYKLTEDTTIGIDNLKNFIIKENIKIDYQQYNQLLTSFKNQYGLSTDGKLTITLVISANVTKDGLERYINKEADVELKIPLSSLAIEVPIEDNSNDSTGILTNEISYNKSIIYPIAKIVSYIMFSLDIILIILLIREIVNKINSENKFNKKLRKILKVYDGIIVNVAILPDIKNYNTVEVSTFEELLDAHGEVRMPINAKVEKNTATFILISDNIAWKYVLK